MLKRLGNVLFWLGITIAIGWALLWMTLLSDPTYHPKEIALAVLLVSAPSLLIGWALRYILRELIYAKAASNQYRRIVPGNRDRARANHAIRTMANGYWKPGRGSLEV